MEFHGLDAFMAPPDPCLDLLQEIRAKVHDYTRDVAPQSEGTASAILFNLDEKLKELPPPMGEFRWKACCWLVSPSLRPLDYEGEPAKDGAVTVQVQIPPLFTNFPLRILFVSDVFYHIHNVEADDSKEVTSITLRL